MLQARLLLRFLSLKESLVTSVPVSPVVFHDPIWMPGKWAGMLAAGQWLPEAAPHQFVRQGLPLQRVPNFFPSGPRGLIFSSPAMSPIPSLQRPERVQSGSLSVGTILIQLLSKNSHFQFCSDTLWSPNRETDHTTKVRGPSRCREEGLFKAKHPTRLTRPERFLRLCPRDQSF